MDLNKHVINTLEKRENDVICEVICNADPKSSHFESRLGMLQRWDYVRRYWRIFNSSKTYSKSLS